MALKKSKFNPEDIKIVGLNILESTIKQKDFFSKSDDISGYDIEMSNETAYNFDEKAARYRLYFLIEGKNKNDEKIGVTAKIHLEFHFQLKNGDMYLKKMHNKTIVDFQLASNLMSVAYATSRGIVWQLTLPSAMKGVMLPVINAAEFLEENH